MNKTDEINSLKLRLSEAQKYTEKCELAHAMALANQSRIRERLEDLLKEENNAV